MDESSPIDTIDIAAASCRAGSSELTSQEESNPHKMTQVSTSHWASSSTPADKLGQTQTNLASMNSDPDFPATVTQAAAVEENICPVCLNSPSNDCFVNGPCGHSLCMQCMEKVLNANASEHRWPPQSAADSHLAAPTLGRCPICRSQLSLFQLRHSISSQLQYPPNIDYWEEDDVDEEERSIISSTDNNANKERDGGNTSLLNNSERNVRSSNPLKNSVYIPYRGRPGQMSFHWDWKKLKLHQNQPKERDNQHRSHRPFLNLTESVKEHPDKWRLEDGSVAPRIKFMEPGCHFHQASRTFHGTIKWPSRLNGSHEWDVVLGFSKDYRFLSSGRIHMKRGRNTPPEDIPDTFSVEQRELSRFPLDGRWTLYWIDRLGIEKTIQIHVVNNEFRQSRWSFFLNFDDPLHPCARWPRSRHRQWVEDGIDLTKHPMGPQPGERIRWKTTDPRFPELFWTRQTVGPVPTPNVTLFGMGQEKCLYQRLHSVADASIPKYNGKSVFGNVFTKRLYIGSSSYHFLSPTNCFISYRHPACRDLPPMDDGSPLPTRVDFHNIEFEEEDRHLTATIEWEKDFGTSWNDNVRWKLDMYFDSEYMIILKGGIQCEWCRERRARPRPPRPPPRHRPPPVPVYVPPILDQQEVVAEEEPVRNEEWVMSGYGHDQVFVNAAALERYRVPASVICDNQTSEENNQETENDFGIDSSIDDEQEPVLIDFKAIAQAHAVRLKKEGATKRSVDFLTYLFQAAVENNNTNPIDYLVHA